MVFWCTISSSTGVYRNGTLLTRDDLEIGQEIIITVQGASIEGFPPFISHVSFIHIFESDY